MSELTLPESFFFGAAMSGPQTEGGWNVGGKLENLWDTWSMEDISSFYNQVGSYVGNDFMHHYKEDLALLKSMGMDNYRTSIQWSRLLDQDGNINPEGAAWYHELFAASKEAGLEVFVNLYHFDLPTYLYRRGGWLNREVCEAYANYAYKLRGLRQLRLQGVLRVRPGGPLLVHVQRAHRRAREPLLAPHLVPAAPQLPGGLHRPVQHLDRPRAGSCPLPPGRLRGPHAPGRAHRHDLQLQPLLHQGRPHAGRPRGPADERRPHQPLVARPRDQGGAARGRHQDPDRGPRHRAAHPPL